MDKLADELLKMILSPPLVVPDELFADGSDLSPFSKATSSASDVLLVCKRFMRVATPALYETVIIRTKAQAAALRAALRRNPEFGRFVRKLRLEAAYGKELAKVIPNMPHVTDFCFTLSVYADESLAALNAAFSTFEPRRVLLTLPETRRGTNMQHKALVEKLCAAIRNWTALRTFCYSKPTRQVSESDKEHDIAVALAESISLEVVDVAARSWEVIEMPPVLRTLLSNIHIRIIRLHAYYPSMGNRSFLNGCPPEVKRRLLFVDTAEAEVHDAPSDPVLLATNPFYSPMQNASREERIAVWTRITSFAVYKDAPADPDYGNRVGSRYRYFAWFDCFNIDFLVAKQLLLVSRDVYEGLIAVLSRNLSLGEIHFQNWKKYLESRPALGAEVQSLLFDAPALGHDPQIDAFFQRMTHLRELDLGSLHLESVRAFERIGPVIGHSLRSLTLSRRCKMYNRSGEWAINPFTADIFSGFVALEKLKVDLDDMRFTGTGTSAATGGDVFPSLKALDVNDAHMSFFTMLSHAKLPKLQDFTIRVAVRKADQFIKLHGAKLVHVHTTVGFNQNNLNACPNLESIELFEEVRPSFVQDCKHARIARLKLNWYTSAAKYMNKYSNVCFLLTHFPNKKFPALKEVVVGGRQEIWPANERDVKKSPWPGMAAQLAEREIVLKDYTGRTWRPRLQIQ